MSDDLERLKARLNQVSERRRLRAGTWLGAGAATIGAEIAEAARLGYDFGVVPLALDASGDAALSDRALPGSTWSKLIGAATFEPGGAVRALERRLGWAAHTGMAAVTVPLGAGGDPVAIAQIVSRHLASAPTQRVWIEVGWDAASWQRWNQLRLLADHHPRIAPLVAIDGARPDADTLERWLAEPIEGFSAKTSVTVIGARAFLERAFRRHARAAITALPRAELDTIFRAAWSGADERAQFDFELKDQLVPPIQPLRDDISSGAYEHFERGRSKYEAYARAIRSALTELGAGAAKKSKKPLVVMVVGSGRGPLVALALEASGALGIPISLYAVEKNPFAAMTLRHRNRDEWQGRVTVVEADMRTWAAPEPAQLLISELLGGFGDNELSPECLDGAERFLDEGGVMIPREYTSWIAPLSAACLWQSVPSSREGPETPYGVTLSAHRHLAEPVRCFRFEHPSRGATNERWARLTFDALSDGALHGFIGYFDAVLHGDVRLSIVPSTSTAADTSWAPVFFPLHTPLTVQSGEAIELTMRRCVGRREVWYEWGLVRPIATTIHNAHGSATTMGL